MALNSSKYRRRAFCGSFDCENAGILKKTCDPGGIFITAALPASAEDSSSEKLANRLFSKRFEWNYMLRLFVCGLFGRHSLFIDHPIKL
jgi:hypothetical protein